MIRNIIAVIGMLTFSSSIFAQSCHKAPDKVSQGNTAKASSEEKTSPQPAIQTICPVMSGSVDRSVFVIWEGDEKHTPKKVYFGAQMCANKFKTNPIKYIQILEELKQPIENAITEQKTN